MTRARARLGIHSGSRVRGLVLRPCGRQVECLHKETIGHQVLRQQEASVSRVTERVW